MTIQSERPQEKRLQRLGLRVLTTFWDGHSVRRRASDGSVRDDIVNGVIMDKKYFLGDRLTHTETWFNPLMQYSYVMGGEMEKDIRCPNCGWEGKAAAFADGCPFCGTCYRISYSDRKTAAARFAEKKAKQPWLYPALLLLCLGLYIGAALLSVRLTGRTFGLFDILKGIGFGSAVGLTAFYCVYLQRSRVISRKAEENYRRRTAMLTDFEHGLESFGLSLDAFFTSLNTELAARFFGSGAGHEDVVDFDILDYDACRIDRSGRDAAEVHVDMTMRILSMRHERLRSAEHRARAVLKVSAVQDDSPASQARVVHCHACGASVDIAKPACEFCGAPIRYRQPLYLTGLELDAAR